MNRVEQTAAWIYEGIWRALTEWFRVPKDPPSLPVQPGDKLESYRPATGFLGYLKFHFWLWLVVIDMAIFITWLIVTIAVPWLGMLLAIPALLVAVVPDVVAYIAIHLRYDTTWYAFSERSLRIRRGVWVIHETTITFENVQNIKITQGPLQRYYGIANLVVETAGGGGVVAQPGHATAAHVGLIEGIDNAPRLRSLIFDRVGAAKTIGLGDEDVSPETQNGFTARHLEFLREIRALAQRLAAVAT